MAVMALFLLVLALLCGAATAMPLLVDGEPLPAEQRDQLRTKPAHVSTPFDCATRAYASAADSCAASDE